MIHLFYFTLVFLTVGKSASRIIGNLVKVDGQITRAYGNRQPRSQQPRDDSDSRGNDGRGQGGGRDRTGQDRERLGSQGHKATGTSYRRNDGGGGGGSGLSNQMNRNLVVRRQFLYVFLFVCFCNIITNQPTNFHFIFLNVFLFLVFG